MSLAEQLGIKALKKGTKQYGKPLNVEDLQYFRQEQIVQLFELMKATNVCSDDSETK